MDGPTNRMLKEYQKIIDDPVPGVTKFEPDPQNFRHFYVEMLGPKGSLYAGGTFKLEVLLPENYPMAPPKITFKTLIYHPYFDINDGRVCLEFLYPRQWSPIMHIKHVLTEIIKLLSNPDSEGLYNIDAAQHWRNNRREAEDKARQYTQKHATYN